MLSIRCIFRCISACELVDSPQRTSYFMPQLAALSLLIVMVACALTSN
jgi:hypothetical protein